LPAATVASVGVTVTEESVTTAPVTVITVDPSTVVPLRVALTNMPTVPPVVSAVNVTPLPEELLRDPSDELERAHV